MPYKIKKVLIIVSGDKGMPAVNGGGVETLTQVIIDNSLFDDVDVVSEFNKRSFEESKRAKKGIRYLFVRNNGFVCLIKKAFWKVLSLLFKRPFGNSYIHAVGRKVNFKEYDLIISENGVCFGTFIRKYYSGLLILHLHNDWLHKGVAFAEEYKNSFDQIWCISDWLKKRVDEIGGKTNTKTIYNCVDYSSFNIKKREKQRALVRRKMGISPDDFVFATCSRVVPEKGVLESILAFKRFLGEAPHCRAKLVIIGDLSSNSPYIKSVRQEFCDNVLSFGWVSHEKVADALSAADAVVMPSLAVFKFNECFNLTLIEATSLGLQAIVTDNGAMPEICFEPLSMIVSDDGNIVDSLSKSFSMSYARRKLFIDIGALQNHLKRFSIKNYCFSMIKSLEELDCDLK